MDGEYQTTEEQKANIEAFLILGKKEGGGRLPTIPQIKTVASLVSGEAKNSTEAVRNGGYSPSMIDNPNKIINSQGVAKAMDMIGMDDRDLAVTNRDLLKKSFRIEVTTFPKIPEQHKEESDEEYAERTKDYISDDQIRELIAGNGGFVKHIGQGYGGRTVVYTFPDNMARLKALELIYKVKGAFAPTQNTNKNLNLNFSPAMLREQMQKRNIEITDLMS
jgi:hypothetical protein